VTNIQERVKLSIHLIKLGIGESYLLYHPYAACIFYSRKYSLN